MSEYTDSRAFRKFGEKNNSVVLIYFVSDVNIHQLSLISEGNHLGFNITCLSPLFSRFYLDIITVPTHLPIYLIIRLHSTDDIVMEI